ncbi:MAG: hypothetical protein JO328_21335 [Hyphomicrobiales bacterium]|nr:hypothetical protein [Hyphomicrobiales bacterium]MBV9429110.1 hypothetical protein [Bradyrhizobiaceae bacterium]
MTRDPVAFLALERAALISADIEEQLTARAKDGMRPLLAVLAKARREAAEAIAALVDTAPSDAAAIARLQNEVRRFADLVRFLREIVNEGLDERYEVTDAERDELERLVAPPDDTLDAEARRERAALGIP